jgi:hypothetical protein
VPLLHFENVYTDLVVGESPEKGAP